MLLSVNRTDRENRWELPAFSLGEESASSLLCLEGKELGKEVFALCHVGNLGLENLTGSQET